MGNPVRLGFLELSALLLVTECICYAQSDMAHASAASPSGAKPLLLEKNEGELRTRRPRPKPSPASQFMLKAGPKIHGSQHLVSAQSRFRPGHRYRLTNIPLRMKLC
jgi:hypothetical protein